MVDFSKYGTPVAQQPTQQSAGASNFSKYGTVVQENIPPEQKKKGVLRQFVEGIFKPAVTLGVRPIQAVKALTGAETPEEQAINVPFFGRIEAPTKGKDIVKDIGRAAETISLGIGGGAVRTGLAGAVKATARQGLKAGALFGGGAGLEEEGKVSDALRGAAIGGVTGLATGAAIPVVAQGVRKAVSVFGRRVAEKTAETVAQKGLLEKGIPEAKVATKAVSPEGKLVTDKAAKEVVRQGIPEADVALIKSGSNSDKSKMLKMLDIRESQLTNKRVTDRASDVAGDTFINKVVKPIQDLNEKAGKNLNIVAKRLAGKKADPSLAVKSLADDFDTAGIKVDKKGNLDFKGSDFEGLKSIQASLKSIWNRALSVGKSRDALQMHRTKKFIDNVVEYGSEGSGLSGRAEKILKSFRRSLDITLDTQFKSYNKANTVFSDTIRQLNELGAVLGRRFRIGDQFADARAGLALRRILGNAQSRADILRLIDGMQKIAKKYGIKIDEDVIVQTNFADILERMLGTEAPTSLAGQVSRGFETFGSTGSIQGGQQIGSTVGEFARGNVVRGTIKAGAHVFDVLRGVNQESRIKALRALLQQSKKSNFGVVR